MEKQISDPDSVPAPTGQSETYPVQFSGKPKLNFIVFAAVAVVIAAAIGISGYFLGKQSSEKSPATSGQPMPPPAITETDPLADWRMYTFMPLGISLKVPGYLTVHTEEPNPGNDFTAYIQNYAFNAPFPKENAYQLYLIWQKTPKVTQAEFNALKNDLDATSVSVTEIAGYPAINGQVKGERNRFVTYMLKDQTKISMFTSEPTEANKELTDRILATITKAGTSCGTCPLYTPPPPGFCSDGTIVPGEENECGCPLPPTCERKELPSISIPYAPKSGWTTYQDDIAKFSFQFNTTPQQPYSTHQSLGDSQPGKSVSVMGCNTPPDKQEICLGQYTVSVYTNYGGGSRRVWMNENIADYPDCPRYYADVSLAGKNAMLATSDCSSFGETLILIPNGSQMIVFLTQGYSRDDTSGKFTLTTWIQDALSTFKFN